MNFIIFNASFRKKGNSDILASLSLKEALNNEAVTAEIINLRDLRLEQCNGCMRCVFKDEICPLKDDFYPLMDKIVKADALLLISSTYVMSIPGYFKMLIDRFLLIRPYYEKLYLRPSASIGVSSPIDWNSFQLPSMNLFLLGLGFKIEESFIVYGAGPGEVLLDDNQISRVRQTVRKICELALNPVRKSYSDQISKHCPVCFSTIFERIEERKFRCPICLSEAEEIEGGFLFSGKSMNNHRWTEKNIEEHFENWILRTKDLFRKNLPEIFKRKKKFLSS
ncbi:MAG: flavodoxin family protein [Acidobacteriota bacterium]